MSIKSRIGALVAKFKEFMGLDVLVADDHITQREADQIVMDELQAFKVRHEVTPGTRSRMPHSNAKARFAQGVPHGVSGAKLARKALAGKVGIR